MELIEALSTTGAARSFSDAPVDDATLAAVLDAARFAPSGGNRQPWRVAVVEDRALRRAIGDLMQAVWNEYVAWPDPTTAPFSVCSRTPPASGQPAPAPNPMLEQIERAPVVLAIAADLTKVAMMDSQLDRAPISAGASVYPFCWSILLAARAFGLGGVLTTFLARAEPAAAPLLGLPPDHALAATIFLGHPTSQPTKLRRQRVSSFATRDRFDGAPFDADPA